VSERVTAHPRRAATAGPTDKITHPAPILAPSIRAVSTRQPKPARIPASSSGPSTDHQSRSNSCRSDAHISHVAATMAASTAPLPAARSAAGLMGKGRITELEIGDKSKVE